MQRDQNSFGASGGHAERGLSPFQAWPSWLENPEPRGASASRLVIAVLTTVLVHSVLLTAMPHLDLAGPPPEQKERAVYTVELLEPEPEPEPERFVEVNPDVLPEEPDPTSHYAAMDQVAAQPDPDGDDSIPDVGGEEDSQKIIDGDYETVVSEPLPWGTPLAATSPVPAAEQAPPPSFFPDVLEGEAEEDNGMLVLPDVPEETVAELAEPVPQPDNRDSERSPAVEVVMEEVRATDIPEGQPEPQPRPRLQPRVTPGPVMRSPSAAGRMGLLAIDARFSEFGAYQQRMIEAISHQWNLLGRNLTFLSADIGTHVVVSFVLHSDGNVSEFQTLHTTSSRAATLLVQDAVMSPAPFGLWTEDMVRVLGESQSIRITFFYR